MPLISCSFLLFSFHLPLISLQFVWNSLALTSPAWEKRKGAGELREIGKDCSTRSRLDEKRRIAQPGLLKIEKNWYSRPILNQKRRIASVGLTQTKNKSELVYQASLKLMMKKNCFTRPRLMFPDKERRIRRRRGRRRRRRRIALPGILWTRKKEELLYQASSKPETKKNCFTRNPLNEPGLFDAET